MRPSLSWSGIGSGKNRTTDVLYVNSGLSLDYEALQAGNAQVNLSGTFIKTETFPANQTVKLTTDVSEAVKTILGAKQNYVIFKFTNNVGSGYLVGKGATDGAPVLTITTTDAKTSNYYVVREINETNQIDTITYQGIIVGEQVSAGSADTQAFEKNNVRYVYVSGADTKLEVTDDETKNYIHLTFKEGDKVSYTINTSLGNTIDSGEAYDGVDVTYYFPRYLVNDGTLYESSKATDGWYKSHFNLTASNNSVTVNYDKKDTENIVFFTEAEDIKGASSTYNNNAGIRCSNGQGAYFTEDTYVTTLESGKYKVTASLWGNAATEFNIKAGDKTVWTASTAGYILDVTGDEFVVEKSAEITIPAVGNEARLIDWLYIQKTGDYNYLTVEQTLPDTLKYEKGTAEEDKPKLSDYITINTNADPLEGQLAVRFFVAKVEAGADKKEVAYTTYNTEDEAKAAMSEEGLYYAYGQVVAKFSADEVYTEYTDTIVIAISEPEEEEPAVVEPVEVEKHTWNFNNWSEATIANLKAEAAKVTVTDVEGKEGTTTCVDNGATWSDHEKKPDVENTTYADSKDNCFWATITLDEDGELSANGETIEELKGLYFNKSYAASRSIAIAVNYPSTSLGTYEGAQYLWLGGKEKDCFTIKNVKVGTDLTIAAESHNTSDPRGVQLKVDGANFGDAFKPTTYAENKWTITSTVDGAELVDVVVTNTNGCHIYWIDAEIGEPTETAVSTVAEAQAEAQGVVKFFENGQLIIVKDGKKYNAAGAEVK